MGRGGAHNFQCLDPALSDCLTPCDRNKKSFKRKWIYNTWPRKTSLSVDVLCFGLFGKKVKYLKDFGPECKSGCSPSRFLLIAMG